MKEICHLGSDGLPLAATGMDDCVLDNRMAPVVRSGSDPFVSYFEVEWFDSQSVAVDPSRSLAEAVARLMDEDCSESNNWPASDVLWYLLNDLGVWTDRPSVAEGVAFWTMFPKGTADFLALPYMREQRFLNRHGNYARVFNNPLFYQDANAPLGRLVEVVEYEGLRYALDRAFFIPPPDVMAKEIALLHHAVHSPKRVDSAATRLVPMIAEVMSDWRLV